MLISKDFTAHALVQMVGSYAVYLRKCRLVCQLIGWTPNAKANHQLVQQLVDQLHLNARNTTPPQKLAENYRTRQNWQPVGLTSNETKTLGLQEGWKKTTNCSVENMLGPSASWDALAKFRCPDSILFPECTFCGSRKSMHIFV